MAAAATRAIRGVRLKRLHNVRFLMSVLRAADLSDERRAPKMKQDAAAERAVHKSRESMSTQ
jgi:hypothetical protein